MGKNLNSVTGGNANDKHNTSGNLIGASEDAGVMIVNDSSTRSRVANKDFVPLQHNAKYYESIATMS